MVHLAVDAAGAQVGGAATIALQAVRAALACPGLGRLDLYCGQDGQLAARLDKALLPQDPRLKIFPLIPPGAGARLRWHLQGLPRALRHSGAEVALCLANGGFAPLELPAAVLIQQSIPFCPEALAQLPLRGRLRFGVIKAMMRLSTRRAALTLVQTETMGRWVHQQLGVPAERLALFPPALCAPVLGAADQGQGAAPGPMDQVPADRRLLYVGSTSPHKNVGVLLEALGPLRERFPGLTLFMALPEGRPVACGIPGVVNLGLLDREQLFAAYRKATALVMPSLVETLGLPMIEAASVGRALLVADRPYAHELCGDAALFFDPHCPHELVARFCQLVDEPQGPQRWGARARERFAAAKRLGLGEALERILALAGP